MLKQRILRTLEKRQDNIDQRTLSRIANLNESSISRFLNGYEEINFEAVLRIVQYLYPEQEREVMLDYIKTLKSRNARHALEYCVMNRAWEHVDDLIKLLSDSSNPVDKEWAALYDLIRIKKEKLLSPMELLQKVEVCKPKELEMQVLKAILKGYLYFDMDQHQSLFLHMEGTGSLIKEIKSNFIKEAFNVRISLIQSAVYLYQNDLEEARRYSYAIVGQDFFEHVKTTAYNTLGKSYMFEDYQKSKEYFLKAINYAITFNQVTYTKMANLNLSFLYSFWEVEREYTESLDNYETLANYIYYLIKKGELSLAQEHINKIDTKKLSEWDKGFYNYYKGLLTDDIETYYNSAEAFLNANNLFYLKLPLLELQRLGESETALKIISSKGGIIREKANKNPIHN